MQEFSVTVVGNLVTEPQLRYIASGAPVCSLRLGVTPRYRNRDSGEWVDATSMFVTVSCWRALAENVAESLHLGDRVVVRGRMRQRDYVTGEGEERTVWEIDADSVSADLSRHTAVLRRVSRTAGAEDATGSNVRGDNPGELPAQAAGSSRQAASA